MTTATIDTLKKEITCIHDKLNDASLLLSGFDFTDEIEELAGNVAVFCPELAESIRHMGIAFWVLWSDHTPSANWYERYIQVDTQEWESTLLQKQISDVICEDEEKSFLLREALDYFEMKVASRARRTLEERGIPPEMLDELAGITVEKGMKYEVTTKILLLNDGLFEVFEGNQFTGLQVFKDSEGWVLTFASYIPDEEKFPLYKEACPGQLFFSRLWDVVTYLQNKKNTMLP
jgi:hypothetical protein